MPAGPVRLPHWLDLANAGGPGDDDGRVGLFLLILGASCAAVIAVLFRARPPVATRTNEQSVPWTALLLLVALAAVLRAIGLDSGLWYDEIITLVNFVRLPPGELVTSYQAQNNHILYSLCAHGSIAAFGESAWTLRLPAAVFGVASIAALLMLGMAVTQRSEAIWAAALATLSYHHVWFSQNARGYTGLLLLTLWGTTLFLRGMRHPARRLWVGYAAVAATAMYIHLTAVFPFTIHGCVFVGLWLWGKRDTTPGRYPGSRELWPLLGFALAALLTLLLYAVLFPQMQETFGKASSAGNTQKVAEWTNPLWTLTEIVHSWPLGPFSWVGVVLFAVVVLAGLASYFRREPALAWTVIATPPFIVACVLALSLHLWPRYGFALMGLCLLVLVRGIYATALWLATRWGRSEPDGILWAHATLAVLCIGSAVHMTGNYQLPKQDHAGAQAFVEQQLAPGDRVLTAGMAARPYEEYAPAWIAVDSVEELDAQLQPDATVWLVYAFRTALAQTRPELTARIDADFEKVATFPGTLRAGTIHVCRRR